MSRKGYEFQYGGFVFNTETGEEELLFTTYFSAILCEHRAVEEANNRNNRKAHCGKVYDTARVTVRCRKIESAVNPWRDSQEEAENDTAIIRLDECWYTEAWTADDLIWALEEIGVDSSVKENFAKALDIVMSEEFQNCFDEESDREEFLKEKLTEYFFSKEQVIKRIVDYIVEEGTRETLTGHWRVYINDIKGKFDVTYKWLQENRNDIRDKINGRKEVLSASWGVFDKKGRWKGFACIFCDEYCQNYKGDYN